MKFGADHTFIRRRDRFLNPQDLLPTTDSRIDERKTAAFAQYVLNVGKVSASAGLRYEHARSRYYEQGILVPEQSRTYDDWLPTLSADFPLGKVQASLSYTAKTTRPSFTQLRTSMNYNNLYIYEGGNPLLQPETVHNVQLLLLWRWLQGNVSYTRRKNAIEFQSRDYEGDADVVLFSSANYPRMEMLDISLFASPKVGCWEPTWGALFTQPFFSVMNEGVRRRLNRASVYVVWRNNWTLPGGWMLSLDASAQTRGDQGTARIAGRTADALAAGTGPVEHAARQYATVRLAPDVREDGQARLAVLPADGELPLPRRGQGLSRETGGGRRLEKVVKERFALSFRVERSGIEKSHYAQKRHAGNKRKTLGRCLDCAALRST